MQNTKTQNFRSVLLYILGAVAWALVIVFASLHVISAQSFIQSYSASQALNQGIIVQLVPGSSSQIEPASEGSIDKAFGVVVNAGDANVALTQNNANTDQTFVATGGRYNVLVSNQNGTVKSGDYVTVSALNGIGMKVDTIQPIIIGTATSDMDNVVGTANLKTTNGTTKTVQLGIVQVDINFRHNPEQVTLTGNVPPIFAKVAAAVNGGKQVPAWKIYLSLAILLIGAVISGAILYGGVRSALISIGRNPLSKKSIMRGLMEITLIALIILIVAIFGVYLLLKL